MSEVLPSARTASSYYRARYYDAQAGRFVNEDPIAFRGGINFYRYARNNPARLSDPFGLSPTTDTLPWVPILGPIIRPIVRPIVGLVVGLGAAGAAVITAVGELTVGAPTTARDEDNIRRDPTPKPCDKQNKRKTCTLIHQFFDPDVDPAFRICVYSCDDGTVRHEVVPSTFACPKVSIF